MLSVIAPVPDPLAETKKLPALLGNVSNVVVTPLSEPVLPAAVVNLPAVSPNVLAISPLFVDVPKFAELLPASINKALKDSGGVWTSELNTLVKERDTSTPAPAAPAPKKDKDNGGSSSGGGGGDKIVCTAMNNSYGFGSYRQAIWLSYSQKNLTKAHEVGYHTIFRPLVKIAYKKNNKFVRAILENIETSYC